MLILPKILLFVGLMTKTNPLQAHYYYFNIKIGYLKETAVCIAHSNLNDDKIFE